MVKNLLFIFILCFLSFLLPLPSFSKELITISAKKLEFLHKTKIITAKNDVKINFQNYTISAEKAKYHINQGYIYLFNFKISNPVKKFQIWGKSAKFDIRNKTFYSDKGIIFFEKTGTYLQYVDITKNVLNEYKGKKGRMTPCKEGACFNSTPPWSLEKKDFLMSPEGENKGKYLAFKIKKLPILFLPGGTFFPQIKLPIFPPRKKGFLFPYYTYGKNSGWGIQIPYFLPITDQLDFTFAPFYLKKRGILWNIENAFKLHQNTQYFFNFRYLKDRLNKEKKWWIVGKADYIPSSNFDMHLDIDILSDKTFLSEFNVGEGSFSKVRNTFLSRFGRDIEVLTQEYRTSHFWINAFKQSVYFNWKSQYLDYLNEEKKDKIFQPLGKFKLSLLPIKIYKNILIDFKVRGAVYKRKIGYTGYKFSDQLGLNFPFSIKGIRNKIYTFYHQDYYFLENKEAFEQNFYYRDFFGLKHTTNLFLKRKYGKFSHILKPYFSYNFRSKTKSSVPIFEEEDSQHRKRSYLEYGLWNFLLSKNNNSFLIFNIYQNYDLISHSFSDLFFKSKFTPYSKFSLKYESAYNLEQKEFKKHVLNINLRNIILDSISIGYYQDKRINTKQVNFSLTKNLIPYLSLNFFISRNLIKKQTNLLRISLNYKKDCYSIIIGVTKTPEEVFYSFMIQLKGIGSYGKAFSPD